MNLTLSADDEVVQRARETARQQGTSLNALIRQYMERLAGIAGSEQVADDLEKLWKRRSGRSKGARIRRADAYADRLK
ncbi:MAG: hypothetical protein K1X64_17975 [Myxococcaceae bacterium]|nr:hypothetical protein [Myxococcaceae bacterium]